MFKIINIDLLEILTFSRILKWIVCSNGCAHFNYKIKLFIFLKN